MQMTFKKCEGKRKYTVAQKIEFTNIGGQPKKADKIWIHLRVQRDACE